MISSKSFLLHAGVSLYDKENGLSTKKSFAARTTATPHEDEPSPMAGWLGMPNVRTLSRFHLRDSNKGEDEQLNKHFTTLSLILQTLSGKLW